MKDAVRAGEAKKDVTRCPYCHESCGPEGVTTCPSCEAPHHAECWTTGSGCSSCAIGRERAPVGTAVPTTGQATALSLDVARETLVRAGHRLADVDALLRPRTSEERSRREGLQLLAALLGVAFLFSGGMSVYHAVLHATNNGRDNTLAVAATSGFVAVASILGLLVFAAFLLLRHRRAR